MAWKRGALTDIAPSVTMFPSHTVGLMNHMKDEKPVEKIRAGIPAESLGEIPGEQDRRGGEGEQREDGENTVDGGVSESTRRPVRPDFSAKPCFSPSFLPAAPSSRRGHAPYSLVGWVVP